MASKLVLFDLDGTLVELWDVHVNAYEATFRKLYGIPNVDFREKYIPGTSPEELIFDVLKNRGYDESFIKPKIHFVRKVLEKNYVKAFEKRRVKVEVLPGVKSVLQELAKRNILCGIVSGNYLSIVTLAINKAGLQKYFAFIVSANDSRDGRERITAAIKRSEKILGRKINPKKVYFFDDSTEGAKNAKKIGIRHIGVGTGAYDLKTLRKAGSRMLLKNLENTEEVLKILEIEIV